MDYTFGFMINGNEFIKIGDNIDVFLKDRTHMDGKLEDIDVQEKEIIVDGVIFLFDNISTMVLLN
jgi:hypothetical protein